MSNSSLDRADSHVSRSWARSRAAFRCLCRLSGPWASTVSPRATRCLQKLPSTPYGQSHPPPSPPGPSRVSSTSYRSVPWTRAVTQPSPTSTPVTASRYPSPRSKERAPASVLRFASVRPFMVPFLPSSVRGPPAAGPVPPPRAGRVRKGLRGRSEALSQAKPQVAADEQGCTPGSVPRVLAAPVVTAIHLGPALPPASCGLPADSGGLPSDVRAGPLFTAAPLDLAPGGVYLAAQVTLGTGGLLHHRFTLTEDRGPRRFVFCGTVPRVTPGGR